MRVKRQTLWWIITGGSAVGLVASLLQTIERINYALHPKVALMCDLNAVFSCSSVFDAWQSRVFGFSNSLVCMIFFATTLGLGLVAATGSEINRRLQHVFHFFSVFFLGFGAWYLWQSTYRIGFVCIFCLFCYSAVIVMNWAWFRVYYQQTVPRVSSKAKLVRFVDAGGDVLVAFMWVLAIASMILFHFW